MGTVTALVWAYCNEGYSGDNGTLGDCTGMGNMYLECYIMCVFYRCG